MAEKKKGKREITRIEESAVRHATIFPKGETG